MSPQASGGAHDRDERQEEHKGGQAPPMNCRREGGLLPNPGRWLNNFCLILGLLDAGLLLPLEVADLLGKAGDLRLESYFLRDQDGHRGGLGLQRSLQPAS